MRAQCGLWLSVFLFGAVAGAATHVLQAADEQYFGTWAGTWEGMGASGGIEVTLEEGTDGALKGGVSVTGQPTYKATFTKVAIDGGKLTATYDFPPENQAEVTLEAKFEGSTATGTWVAREKAGGTEVAQGTWSVKRP
jgi:hypothetical protein